MRYRVAPRDVPAEIAARRLGLTLEVFHQKLLRLQERGFPQADPDTGHFDLNAIDRWCDARNPHLFHSGEAIGARSAESVVAERIKRMMEHA